MRCPQCQTENVDAACYCIGCGTQLVKPRPRRVGRRLFLVVAAGLIALVLFFAISFGLLRYVTQALKAEERIAYLQTEEDQISLWVVTPDGASRSKVFSGASEIIYPYDARRQESNPFSPDGSTLLFSAMKDGRYTLYLADASGENPSALDTSDVGLEGQFTPDARHILVVTKYQDGTSDLAIANASGKLLRKLGSRFHLISYELAPNGKQLLVQDRVDGMVRIRLLDLQGERTLELVEHSPQAWAKFSPDGRSVLLWHVDKDAWREHLLLVEAQSGKGEVILEETTVQSGGVLPTGTALWIVTEQAGRYSLAVLDLHDRSVNEMVAGADGFTVLASPSNDWLAVSVSYRGKFDLFAVDQLGRGPYPLSLRSDEIDFRISPDGERVAFFEVRDDTRRLVVSDWLGESSTVLYEGHVPVSAFSFSRDSKQVVLEREEEGKVSIYTNSVEGGDWTRLVEGGHEPRWSN